MFEPSRNALARLAFVACLFASTRARALGRALDAMTSDLAGLASHPSLSWTSLVDRASAIAADPIDPLAEEAAVFSGGVKSVGKLGWTGFGGPPFAWATAQRTCFASVACDEPSVLDEWSLDRGILWTGGGGPLVHAFNAPAAVLGSWMRIDLDLSLAPTLVGYVPQDGPEVMRTTAGALAQVVLGITPRRGWSARLCLAYLAFRVPRRGTEGQLLLGAAVGGW